MKRTPFPAIAIIAVSLAVLGGMALAAQDRFTLKVPNGLAFSEFKGYETWQNVAVSQTENGLKVIAANPAMINAYQARHPRQWQAFSRWLQDCEDRVVRKKEPRVPLFRDGAGHSEIGFVHREGFQEIPGLRADGDMPSFIMMRASDTFKPFGSDAACGYACHTAVKAKDYIFTAYPRR